MCFVPYIERRLIKIPATETIHWGITLLPRIIAHIRARSLLRSFVVDIS